jgi:tetratricopeptide (TPR) repeat protein
VRRHAFLLAHCLLLGCTAAGPRPGSATAAHPEAEPIAFFENDYPQALADARARGVPLFIDAWAPWCHTCLSMRNYVFPAEVLRRRRARFAWLALDTERAENAAVVERLSVEVLPTLYVLDAASEQPVLAWPGSLTADELASLLDDAESSVQRKNNVGAAGAALLRGLRASASGKSEEALAGYRSALAIAPADWPKRPQGVDGLVTELAKQRAYGACVTAGADEAPNMPPGSPLADVLRAAMGCAAELPKDAPERERWSELVAIGERVAADPKQPILADDRSDLYGYVVGGLAELGRQRERAQAARSWGAMLEEEAGHAPTPAARAVFDAHRLLAYLAMGQPERAVPMLELSEREFPGDYNPPARLAVALRALKQYDEALMAIGRALGLAYGPRKLRLWLLQADLYEDKGDRAAVQRSLQAARTYADAVPLTGNYPKIRDLIVKRLDANARGHD